ncbi:MAG: hypothetical protein AB1540_01865 [Bdellovibrionota bacterium]
MGLRLCAWLCLVLPSFGIASETDQYFAWDKPLKDSTSELNALVNQTISGVVRAVGEQNLSCHSLSSLIRAALALEGWKLEFVSNYHSEIDRVPFSESQKEEFDRESFYGSEVDFKNRVMPKGQTVLAAGVRFGFDKIQHFFSTGFRAYERYREVIERQGTEEEAVKAAVDYGISTEWRYLGMWSSGVFSFGDLEADYQGVRFYSSLCRGEKPRLTKSKADNRWQYDGSFDFRDYVSPAWDESYNPSVYNHRRWVFTKKIIQKRCNLLRSNEIQSQRDRYRNWSTPPSASMVYIESLLKQGEKVPDPTLYSVEKVCEERIP